MFSLDGRRALVCGASKGIGRAIAENLLRRKAEVIAIARDHEQLRSLEKAYPGQVESWAVDISDPRALDSVLTKNLSRVGVISILINNTGGPKGGPLMDATSDDLQNAFRHHIGAAQALLRAVVPGMRLQRWGRIVNIISTSVKAPIPNLGVSNTVRAAMANWAKTLATELGPDQITVNNVLPGYTATDRLTQLMKATAERTHTSVEVVAAEWIKSIPVGRFAQAEEIAAAVGFLVSDEAAYINGINLPVDGGRTQSL